MKKKRSTHTGSLKGFGALIVIIAGALGFFRNSTAVTVNTDGQTANEQTENRTESPINNETVRKSSISSKLEIPVDLQNRKEIRITHTGYTVSYNNEY